MPLPPLLLLAAQQPPPLGPAAMVGGGPAGEFIHGIVMMAYAVAGLCFLRFWRKARDRFFLLFALAFWVLAANRVVIAFSGPPSTLADRERVLLYILRLVAFVILLIAILDKNRPRRTPPGA